MTNPQSLVASGIHRPTNQPTNSGEMKGRKIWGTEAGIVELADGEAQARLGEAAVGKAAAAAAGESSDAVRAAAGDVLEGEGGVNVAGVGGRRADAGRHRAASTEHKKPRTTLPSGIPQKSSRCFEPATNSSQ
uniref:Uncharacterized protein n=1 Tax=Arundo donax TaxID=35708 RepID=A0A0A9DCC2_ARUDO